MSRANWCGFYITYKVMHMQPWAESFYKSKRWQSTRLAYIKSKGGLCERCLKRGIYRPAQVVHHKVYITQDNITDPNITLEWNNLEALCKPCHEAEHGAFYTHKQPKPKDTTTLRYTINADGTVSTL